ncbi:DUF6491 family protein [Pseudomonas sp. NY15181]|uniref:DUF6491 family protein n=1 Tax=Pseudomonas sp. NY15181 TaxID=3400349 RepID=UPI003A873005
MRSVHGAILLAAISLLAACSHSSLHDDQLPLDQHLEKLGLRQGDAVKSIPVRDTEGWQYLDKGHIVLGQSPGRRYLVTFSAPCNNLGFSNRLNISNTVGSVTTLDRIISVDSAGIPEPCLIGQLHELERVPKKPQHEGGY